MGPAGGHEEFYSKLAEWAESEKVRLIKYQTILNENLSCLLSSVSIGISFADFSLTIPEDSRKSAIVNGSQSASRGNNNGINCK